MASRPAPKRVLDGLLVAPTLARAVRDGRRHDGRVVARCSARLAGWGPQGGSPDPPDSVLRLLSRGPQPIPSTLLASCTRSEQWYTRNVGKEAATLPGGRQAAKKLVFPDRHLFSPTNLM